MKARITIPPVITRPARTRPGCNSNLASRRRKARFLAAVERLAPCDALLHRVARRYPEARLHPVPEISAVHFVIAFYHLL